MDRPEQPDQGLRAPLYGQLHVRSSTFYKVGAVVMAKDCHFLIRSLAINYGPLHVSMTQRYFVKLFDLVCKEKVMYVLRWWIFLIQNAIKRWAPLSKSLYRSLVLIILDNCREARLDARPPAFLVNTLHSSPLRFK